MALLIHYYPYFDGFSLHYGGKKAWHWHDTLCCYVAHQHFMPSSHIMWRKPAEKISLFIEKSGFFVLLCQYGGGCIMSEETQELYFQSAIMPSRAFLCILPQNLQENGDIRFIEIHGSLSIGRNPDCELVLADPFISSHHATIYYKKKNFFVCDQKSRNGTFVNGVRIQEAQLFPGDCLRIGHKEMTFQLNRKKPNKKQVYFSTKNAGFLSEIKNVALFAKTDLCILLLGESGTGKDVFARYIHEHSPAKKGPFVSVNCCTLSETLVESELFGHKKGAFTGADYERKGAFETARNGTLFLDEIGDLPLTMQSKLLRVLENKEITPVGSDKIISTSTRVIAATHQNLEALIEEKKFRSDLYFRLNVLKVEIPPLRQRLEDFYDLVEEFSNDWNIKFSKSAMEWMAGHHWPGNIRELKNFVARAGAMFPGKVVFKENIERWLNKTNRFSVSPEMHKKIENSAEVQHLLEALQKHNGNQRKTAEFLGIPPSTLHDRLKKHHIRIERKPQPLL